MKKFYIVIFMLIVGRYCAAQNSGNEWTILFNKCFEADSTGVSSVNLSAKPAYVGMPTQSKSSMIDNILSMRNRKVAYVSYGHSREIWGKNSDGVLVLLDNIDMNNSDLRKAAKESQKLIKHPWFFYFGGQGMFTSEELNSLYLGIRGGCFLLRNRWDIALSTAINASEEVIAVSPGLASKYYFPIRIKEQRISPYFGGGIDFIYSLYEDYDMGQTDFSALAGISWAIGPGSLDFGMQYGKVSKLAFTIGYTFFPWGR